MFFSIYKSRNLIYYIIFDMVTSLIQVHEVIAIGENEMVQNVLQFTHLQTFGSRFSCDKSLRGSWSEKLAVSFLYIQIVLRYCLIHFESNIMVLWG